MKYLNIEIKARSNNQDAVRNILKKKGADFKGLGHQIDTYFQANSGRLKLREGNIENQLIYYQRENKKGPKQSNTILFKTEPNSSLKDVLINAIGPLVVVDKQREIYCIDNVKFHVDTVKELGAFVEIEAIDESGRFNKDELLEQCKFYLKEFGIDEKDLVSVSYSDLLLEKQI